MILLWLIAIFTVALCASMPLLSKWGERRLERDKLELQALFGEVTSEMRAEAYFDSRS